VAENDAEDDHRGRVDAASRLGLPPVLRKRIGLRRTIGLARAHGPVIAGPFPVVEQFNERDERGTVRTLGPFA